MFAHVGQLAPLDEVISKMPIAKEISHSQYHDATGNVVNITRATV